jgi:hypothetical protein
LKSLHTFTDKSVQAMLADFEQLSNAALAKTCPVQRERRVLAIIAKNDISELFSKKHLTFTVSKP